METKKNNSPTLLILKREFHRIVERKTLYLLSIILPIVIFTLFANIYKYELVRKVPIAICDQDRTPLSRLIIRSIESTSSMTNVSNCSSIDEVKELFMKGKIAGAFFIPPNMESDIKSNRPSAVIIYKGTHNLITGNYIYNDGVKIIKTVSSGVVLKKLKSAGFGQQQAMNYVNPIRVQAQILYNPNYSYESYLVPGMLTVTLQMIIMVVAALIISSEITHDTFKELAAAAKYRMFPVLVGKSVPHIIIHSSTALMILGIFFNVFNIPINGSILYTALFMLFFVVTSFYYGFLISTIFADQQMATEAVLFINTPAFLFSGFTFPIWGMPLLHQVYSQTIPYTHFLMGFLKLYQMNTPLSYVKPEFIALSLFLAVSFAGTCIILKLRINKAKKISVQEVKND